jgi:DtxR family Mn-dependent transcriptional regulator
MTQGQKKFSSPGLTHSAAHHLLAVSDAIDRQGYARCTDIARELAITRGSVSVAMQSLKSAGYVAQDENHFFHLSDSGRKAVASIQGRHQIVERFLTEVLGLPSGDSHRESCRLEYLIEAHTARRLFALLEFWRKRDLDGALEKELGQACPVCREVGSEQCPCCGMECLEDSRSLDVPAGK